MGLAEKIEARLENGHNKELQMIFWCKGRYAVTDHEGGKKEECQHKAGKDERKGGDGFQGYLGGHKGKPPEDSCRHQRAICF